jgi:hypothetical protein
MAKLNTQTSVVDYLKSQGKDSSYSARKKLASNYGISNYSGTASQNTQLLKALQSGKSSSSSSSKAQTSASTSAPKTTTTTTTAKTNAQASNKQTTKTTLNGVDNATTSKMNSTYTPSASQTSAQTKAETNLSNFEQMAGNKNIISNSVMNALNSQFVVPSAVREADAYLKNQLSVIQSGKTSYTDQVKDMMSQIQNREKFSYDVDTDPLFQQALASAMSSGKQAMQDTIGQASALTGGYGSTYATSAANQSYNAFIEDAYDNLPQYYQMAMEAYQMEGDEMYRQLGMLNEADDREFNRNVTAYDATYQHRNQMYNEAYTQYRDNKSDAFNMANLQLSENAQLVNNAYNLYNATSNYADTLYEREYSKWADEVNQAMQYAGMLNSDWWNQTNYDRDVFESDRTYDRTVFESDRAYDRDVFESDRTYDRAVFESDRTYEQTEKWNQADDDYRYAALKQADEHHNDDMGYKWSSLNEEKRQFNAKQSESKQGYIKDDEGNEYKEPTSAQKQAALKAYNERGDAGFNEYIDSLPSDVYVEAIYDYVYGYTDDEGNEVDGYGEEPYLTRTYTKTEQTTNWGLGVDNNDKVKDNHGKEYTLKQLKEKLKSEGVDDDTIDEIMDELNKKDKDATYKYSSKK